MIPDFTLPPTYTVPNTTPLPEKIESFSDETLFMIFYQNPRDELQERAAAQLYNRDWRWHKVRQQWLTKAKEYGEPILSQNRQEERGWYYFWNVNEWKRDKVSPAVYPFDTCKIDANQIFTQREFILNYDHLYHSGLSNSM
jgi:CCR4-NOT transcription complex subunit 2